jgi:spore coat polysaccharide biosynthesis protein SpsF (cytidylyltransferase family)
MYVENLVIIQARMGSVRFPGKSMKYIGDKPLIEHVIRRALGIKVNKIIAIATTHLEEDDVLADYVKSEFSIEVFRGEPLDVRSRFTSLVSKYNPINVLRLTADDPFKDPKLAEDAINNLTEFGYDYVSNFDPQCLPIGLDVEAFTAEALMDSVERFQDHENMEHVTPGIRQSGLYRTNSLSYESNLQDFRLTIDYPEDLEKCRMIYKMLYEANSADLFDYKVICEMIETAKELGKA